MEIPRQSIIYARYKIPNTTVQPDGTFLAIFAIKQRC